MTPEEALAEAIPAAWNVAQEIDNTPEAARRILAALPHGWRLTDDQPSADAYRRGYAEGAAEVRRRFLGDGE